MLLAFVIPSILVGVTARSHLVNINALFDRRLRETDHLMVTEPVAIEDDRFRLATVVKAMRDPQEYREIFDERSAAFEAAYPKLVARGVIALLAIPLALFALSLVFDAKLPLIAGLAVALIVIYVYIIVVEYFHDRIVRKRALTELSHQELEVVLENTLRDELMPYASIDAIVERRRKRQGQGKGVIGKVHKRVEERIAEKVEQRVHANDGNSNVPAESVPEDETGNVSTDVQAEETQVEGNQVDDVPTGNTQADDAPTDDDSTGEIRIQDAQTEDTQTEADASEGGDER